VLQELCELEIPPKKTLEEQMSEFHNQKIRIEESATTMTKELDTATASPSAPSETETTEARHGVGDRKVYYNKWDTFAREGIAEIEEEENKAKEIEEQLQANLPKSESDKKDREKREALKEAKKHWDGVTANENAQKIVIENQTNIQNKVFHFENDFQSRRVLVLKENTDCSFILPADMSLIKIFVEGCKRCSITFNCNVATSTIEVTFPTVSLSLCLLTSLSLSLSSLSGPSSHDVKISLF
jgi:DNA repair exonuclease SbcCD ATPase subunit